MGIQNGAGKMAGSIRTNAAAELLGVSASTLRTWERRLGFPKPRRTRGGHRMYDLQELEALRQALRETHSISAAVQIARRRGAAPSSCARLLDVLEQYDEEAADRVLEESLALRSLERTVEEVLLPAIEKLASRPGLEAEHELAVRWATGWLYAARRVAPPASRREGVLLLDAGRSAIDLESLYVQALDVALRRSGLRVVVVSAEIGRGRIARALRALERPVAIVLCGRGATLGDVAPVVHAARAVAPGTPLLEYRGGLPVRGSDSGRSVGATPSDAVHALVRMVENAHEGVQELAAQDTDAAPAHARASNGA